jgi:hypothetical protein
MRWSIGLVVGLLAAISLPRVGEFVAVVIVGFVLVPIAAAQHWIGPLTDGIADAYGIKHEYALAGTIAAFILGFGVYCLVRALYRRDSDYGAAAILCMGYLAVTVAAYFRLGQGWRY